MTEQVLRGVATGDHPTPEMFAKAYKAIGEHLDVDPRTVRAVLGQELSFGDLRSKAAYLAQEDFKNGVVKSVDEGLENWFRKFGIDPNNPSKNL
jgi:hypothetical protein